MVRYGLIGLMVFSPVLPVLGALSADWLFPTVLENPEGPEILVDLDSLAAQTRWIVGCAVAALVLFAVAGVCLHLSERHTRGVDWLWLTCFGGGTVVATVLLFDLPRRVPAVEGFQALLRGPLVQVAALGLYYIAKPLLDRGPARSAPTTDGSSAGGSQVP
jgi:hypothetical protein